MLDRKSELEKQLQKYGCEEGDRERVDNDTLSVLGEDVQDHEVDEDRREIAEEQPLARGGGKGLCDAGDFGAHRCGFLGGYCLYTGSGHGKELSH